MGDIFLETDRLTLYRFTPADVETILTLDSDPVVMRYVIPPRTRPEIEKYVADVLADYDRFPGLGRWLAHERATGRFVGIWMLKPLQETEHIEVGYRMFEEFWGRGFATEVARALVRHGFETVRLRQIVGITHPDNAASQHVLEKCGLQYQRTIRLGFVEHPLRFYTIDSPTA